MNWRRGLLRTWVLGSVAWFMFACWAQNPLPQLMTPRAQSDPAPVLVALDNALKAGVGDPALILAALRKADEVGDTATARRLAKMWADTRDGPHAPTFGPVDAYRLKAAGFSDQEIRDEELRRLNELERRAAASVGPLSAAQRQAAQAKAIANARSRLELEFKARSAVETYQPVNKWAVLGSFSALGFLPPLIVLGIGLALGWALRGFRGDKSARSIKA